MFLSWRDARAQRRQAAGRLSYKPLIEALEDRLVMSVGTTPAPSPTFQAGLGAALVLSAGMFEGTTPAPSPASQADLAAALALSAGMFEGTPAASPAFQAGLGAALAISASMFDLTGTTPFAPWRDVQIILPVVGLVPVRQTDYVVLSNTDDHGLGGRFVGPLPALPASFAAFSPLSSSANIGVARAANDLGAARTDSAPSTGIGLSPPVPAQQTTIMSGLFNAAALPLGTLVVSRESPPSGGQLVSTPALARTTPPGQADDTSPNETARTAEAGRDVYHQPLYRVADRREVGIASDFTRMPTPALGLSGTGSIGLINPSPIHTQDDATPSASAPPTAGPEIATAAAAQSSLSFLEVAAMWAGFQIMYVHVVRQNPKQELPALRTSVLS